MVKNSHDVIANKKHLPLRIVHIISGDLWAGAEAQVFQTITALKLGKYPIDLKCVLFNDGILAKRLRLGSVDVLIIDERRFNSFEMLLKMVRILRMSAPDIIHVHHIKEQWLACLGAKIAGVSAPIIRTLHGMSRVPRHLKIKQFFRSALVVGLDYLMVKFASDVVIAVSRDLEIQTQEKRIRGSIRCIYNAIGENRSCDECDKERIRQNMGVKCSLWVVTATRLVEPKNLRMLIDVGCLLSAWGIDFKISIFGIGPMEEELKRKIRDYQLDAMVELQGFTQRLGEILKAADVFVMCSCHEGLPMALLEAMAAGIPVVCTAVGGMKEVVTDGKDGVLVPLNDTVAMAQAILRIGEDKDFERQLIENAAKTIRSKFNISKNTGKLYSIYSSLSLGGMR